MALVLKDRVKETTTTTGTGTLTLAGAVAGFQSFSAIGNANTTYYAAVHQDAGTPEWEVGIGTYTASGTTLARTTVLQSSNGGSAVDFSAGTKDVFVTYPSDKAVAVSSSPNFAAVSATSLNVGTSVGIGTTNRPSNKDTVTPTFLVNGAGVKGSAQVIRNTSPGGGGALLKLGATRGSDVNDYTIVQSGDGLGTLSFDGADGNEIVTAAQIQAAVDGTPGDNDMPGRLIFGTTSDGGSSSTERMRINSSGNVGIGTSSPLKQLHLAKSAVADVVSLTDGTSIAVSFNDGQNFAVQLAGSRTLESPTNCVAGQVGSIFVIQDGTGSRTLSYGGNWKFVGGTAPTLSTAASAVDRIDYIVFTSTAVHANASLDVK